MPSIKLQRSVNNISRDNLGLSEGTTNKHIYEYIYICMYMCVCRGTEMNKQTNNTVFVCAPGHSVGNVNHHKRKFMHSSAIFGRVLTAAVAVHSLRQLVMERAKVEKFPQRMTQCNNNVLRPLLNFP